MQMEIKQIKSFAPNCKTTHICINTNLKYFSPLSKEIMHISQILHKYFSPFLSIINKGFKVKTNHQIFSPPFCHKQKDQ